MTKIANVKKSNNAKTVETKNDELLTVADVARELSIDPKRARSFLRKNPTKYIARKKSFTKTSNEYKTTRDALSAYAKRTAK